MAYHSVPIYYSMTNGVFLNGPCVRRDGVSVSLFRPGCLVLAVQLQPLFVVTCCLHAAVKWSTRVVQLSRGDKEIPITTR